MKIAPDITLEEAQMKFIEMTQEKRYPDISPTWIVVDKIYSSEFIWDLENIRPLLWQEGKRWAASLSVQVGESGEWILAGGIMGKQKKPSWKLPTPFRIMREAVIIKEVIQRWGREKDPYLNVIAMAKFAHKYTRIKGSMKMIERILTGIESGVTSDATVAEAFSIVQHQYCRNRLDRMWVCQIWRETFRYQRYFVREGGF